MKDKLIAVATLGFIFSLFFYYKVISPVDSTSTLSEIDESNQVVHFDVQISEEKKLNEMTTSTAGSFELDENDNMNCKLHVDETNELSFSDAFKYFRICNGTDSSFNWNENIYSTLLKSEVESKILLTADDETTKIEDFSVADKKHLLLQNELIGDNLK